MDLAEVSNPCDDCDQKPDRISDLPEEVRQRILAFLPTKQAVATTVLSTEWKNLLPFPPNFDVDIKLDFDFDDTSPYRMKGVSKSHLRITQFKEFVDRVFDCYLRDVSSITEMRLRYTEEELYDDEQFNSWFRAAVRLNVQRLFVNVGRSPWKSSMYDSILVHNLQGCKTLTSMKLGGYDKRYYLNLTVPKDFSLPNLKELSFEFVRFGSNGSLESFLKGCPQLLKLCVSGIRRSDERTLSICSPCLEHLNIHCCEDIQGCKVMLDIPQVKIFVYNDDMAENYVIKSPMTLLLDAHIEAQFGDLFWGGSDSEDEYHCPRDRINEHIEYSQHLAELVGACSNARFLYLSSDTILAVQRISYPELQAFSQLARVTVGRLYTAGWNFLARLLERAPNLERLIMEGFYDSAEGFVEFESSLLGVPMCLSSRMKEINIWAKEAGEDEIKLIEYFLINSKILETLQVHTKEPELMKKRLLAFPTHSKACNLFIEEVPKNYYAASHGSI